MEAYLKFDEYHIKITGNHDYIDTLSFVDEDGVDDCLSDSMVFKAKQQVQEYLLGLRQTFDLNLKIDATDFEQNVYAELQKIPYNELVSYKDIATKINKPQASRAVGNANNKNKIAIIIPCHRVIGSNGRLVGYAGGLDLKQKLIELEQNNGGYYG